MLYRIPYTGILVLVFLGMASHEEKNNTQIINYNYSAKHFNESHPVATLVIFQQNWGQKVGLTHGAL